MKKNKDFKEDGGTGNAKNKNFNRKNKSTAKERESNYE